MGREAQKKREEEGAVEKAEETPQEEQQVQIDPAMLAMQHMNAFEDRRYLVQTVAVGPADPNGMRELSFPISPLKQITLVLAEELVQHILKEFSGGIEIADLGDIAAVKQAAEEEKKREGKS